MDTAYKTRAWWMLRALSYMTSIAIAEQNQADYNESPGRFGDYSARNFGRNRPSGLGEQGQIWHQEGAKAAVNAVAPAGSEALTRRTVDRQGNLLSAFSA